MFRVSLGFVVAVFAMAIVACGGGSGSNPTPSPASTASTQSTSATVTASSSAAPATVIAGVSAKTIRSGDRDRGYRVYVPESVAASKAKVPLVVALHGGLGNPQQFENQTRFDDLAKKEGFVVVYPEGVAGTWNGGNCCGQASNQKIDDVGFIAALIQQLEGDLPVDPARVFMTGHSNGAIMAWRFACDRADLVAAVVPVAGSIELADCKPSLGVPILTLHGDADQNHPLNGGMGPRSIANVSFKSMAATMAQWTAAEGCTQPAATGASGPLTKSVWSGCRGGTTAAITIIAGADHPWPGSMPLARQAGGEPTQLLDATQTAWEFFKSTK